MSEILNAVKAEREHVIHYLRRIGHAGLADFVQEGLHVDGSYGDLLTPYENDGRDPARIPAAPPHALSPPDKEARK